MVITSGIEMADPKAILDSVFGFQEFRLGQEEIVAAVIMGKNCLAIMPTGGGKSLCFQLPALCRTGLTVVISPLIALMRDQVRALRALGVEAGALTSANREDENEEVFAALDEGRLRLLYMAPERLASGATLQMLGVITPPLSRLMKRTASANGAMIFAPIICALVNCAARLACRWPPSRPPPTQKLAPRS